MSVTSTAQTINGVTQESTDEYTLVAGSLVNMLRYTTLSYTIKNIGEESIDWRVIGGNESDLSDGVVVNAAATIAADAFGTAFAATSTAYQWYGIEIVDTVGDSHGEAQISGIAKR